MEEQLLHYIYELNSNNFFVVVLINACQCNTHPHVCIQFNRVLHTTSGAASRSPSHFTQEDCPEGQCGR